MQTCIDPFLYSSVKMGKKMWQLKNLLVDTKPDTFNPETFSTQMFMIMTFEVHVLITQFTEPKKKPTSEDKIEI